MLLPNIMPFKPHLACPPGPWCGSLINLQNCSQRDKWRHGDLETSGFDPGSCHCISDRTVDAFDGRMTSRGPGTLDNLPWKLGFGPSPLQRGTRSGPSQKPIQIHTSVHGLSSCYVPSPINPLSWDTVRNLPSPGWEPFQPYQEPGSDNAASGCQVWADRLVAFIHPPVECAQPTFCFPV